MTVIRGASKAVQLKNLQKRGKEVIVGMGEQGNSRQCSGRKCKGMTWKPGEGHGRLGYGRKGKGLSGMTRKCKVEQERQGKAREG